MNTKRRNALLLLYLLLLLRVHALVIASESQTGNVLLLSDIHFDPLGDRSIVTQLLNNEVSKWPNILASAPSFQKGLYPSFGSDTNYYLLKSALSAAVSKEPFDFVLISGDYLRHRFARAFNDAVGPQSDLPTFATKTAVFVVESIQRAFSVPVYFALGNDDSPCGDYATDVQGPFLRTLADSLQVLRLHPDALATFRVGGFYELPHPTLSDEEIIVLNTVLWSPLSFCCRSKAPDPGETEMQWLEARLHKAKRSAKKVILVMHIPPGIDAFASSQTGYGKPPTLFWRDIYWDEFHALMRNYGDLVKIGVAGHTHMDEFRVLANGDPSKTVAFRITPAISPIFKNNPAFSILKYNIKTGDILDIDTYYLDLAKSLQPERWNNEYTFSKVYGYPAFNAENLLALAARIRNDRELRDVYDRYYSALGPVQINSENWPFYSCAQTTFRRQDFEKSVESLRNHIERPAE